jgi:hypothetical protein
MREEEKDEEAMLWFNSHLMIRNQSIINRNNNNIFMLFSEKTEE